MQGAGTRLTQGWRFDILGHEDRGGGPEGTSPLSGGNIRNDPRSDADG